MRFPWALAHHPACCSWSRSRICFRSRSPPSTASRFTVALFIVFTISERINARKIGARRRGLEQFNLDHRPEVTGGRVQARPGCVLVAVRDYSHMPHLQNVLRQDQPAPARHCCDDRADSLHGRRRVRALPIPDLLRLREGAVHSRCHRWPKKRASRSTCWWCPASDPFDALVQTAATA